MDLTYPREPLKGIRSCSRSSAVDLEEATFQVTERATRQALTRSLWEQRPQPENPRNGVSPQPPGPDKDPGILSLNQRSVPEDPLAPAGGTPTHEELGGNRRAVL